MMFTTPEFFFLLIVTFVVYYLFPRARLWILTASNFIFYGVIGYGYFLLFAAVSFITYGIALGIHASERDRVRKVLLFVVLFVNLGNLVFFKYTVYMIRLLERVISVPLLSYESALLHLVLPLGISFYTFELLSYIIDTYKRRIEPERSLLRFWIFIMFFAHMIAGPIMRGNEFLPQIRRLKAIRFEMSNMRLGLMYLLLGLFKKVCIADYLAPYVDSLFQSDYLTGMDYWLAPILFAFQIYADFSGYSDIAIGIGYLFGLQLAINFRTPYISAHSGEFWRRWHITLSSWIRDYIYIPLGGSRVRPMRAHMNVLIAMGLSGLWHGAATTFIVWGLYYGFLGIAHRYYGLLLERIGWQGVRENRLYRAFAIGCFFGLTCVGWVFFRVKGLTDAVQFLQHMFTIHSVAISEPMRILWWVALGLFTLHIAEYYFFRHLKSISDWWHTYFPAPLRAATYTTLVMLLAIFVKFEQNTFIYFQF